jgi:hypothetical protein
MKFEVPIEHWTARAGTLKSCQEFHQWLVQPHELAPRISAEAVSGVNAMALRRTSSLGNAAVAIGRELLDRVPAGQPVSVVTVSELGELQTNDLLIETVVEGSTMSPQRFASSVHNHVLGQMCINLDLPCPGGASTGARSGLEMGVVEALSEMATGRWVLLLAFEPMVDEHYTRWCGGPAPEHVVGLLLHGEATVRLNLEQTRDAPCEIGSPYALNWLSVLIGTSPVLHGSDGWRWSHVAG